MFKPYYLVRTINNLDVFIEFHKFVLDNIKFLPKLYRRDAAHNYTLLRWMNIEITISRN